MPGSVASYSGITRGTRANAGADGRLHASPAAHVPPVAPLLSLLMADTCLVAPCAAWPRAVLGALFATLLDAAAEPAWLASRLYRYTACSESAGYCILEVDPKNYVSWFLLMTLCFRVFLLWDGLPVVSMAPQPIIVIPYVAWLSVLIWYTNLIRASGGGLGIQANTLLVGLVPLLFAACCTWARLSQDVRKPHQS